MRVTVELGGLRFAVGSPSDAVDRRLRAALAEFVVADDPEAPEAYVLSVPDGGRGLYTLHRFDCPVVRARSAARLLDGLRRHIAADIGSHPEGLVPVRAVALATPDGLVLLPDRVRRRLIPRSRRLVAAGVVPLDAPVVGLEPSTGTLVVPPPPLGIPEDAAASFADLGGDESAQPPGRHALRALAVPAGAHAEDVAAVRALHLLALVEGEAADPAAAVDGVLRTVDAAQGWAMPTREMADPAALLARLG